jgi:undecaprenyl-diphosphatase
MRPRQHHGAIRWWRQPFQHLTRLERHEISWLLIALAGSILLFAFLELASEVMEGETLAFDTKMLRALRNPADPARLIGPPWLQGALLDLTSLGSPVILGLVVFSVVGFLLLQTRYRTALFVLITSTSAWFVNYALKSSFERTRPNAVPHLRDVTSPSFPSGHALTSAVVYLTLGAVLMHVSKGRITKIYCLAAAMMLTLLAGISRVCLGVHYPTDVIAGWIVGLLWASLCWGAAQMVERRTGMKAEQRKAGTT